MKNIKLKKFKIIQFRLILKKVVKKLSKKIYYCYRRISIKKKLINLEKSFFSNFIPNCNFLYDVNKKEQYISELNKLSVANLIIISANKICSHTFNLLGSKDKCLGKKLSWNKDFKTGFKWDNKFYKDIKIIDLSNDADVKVPWELSRFQHIFTIGKAYWITNDEKYALEFKEEVEDWIEKNPVEMSVNWTCTMDVSIRAVNWICGYFFFKESNSIEDKFWIELNKSLYLHGRFIYKNLENEGQHNTNHYLSNLIGLIWIGLYFGDFHIADKVKKNAPKDWLSFGCLNLESEMKKEVNDDGTDYESSTSYHRLVTEMFLITTIFCNKNDINFSNQYMQKLEKMCEFIMDITKPNGLAPIIGDADDGRLIIQSNYCNSNKREFRNILAIAGEYFNRDDFRIMGNDYKEDAVWVIGGYKYVNKRIYLKSKAYSKGGYYIIRNDRAYCIIRCGELSCRGKGGHSHNDQLSFELNVDGEDFIIDPGTYAYTSDYKMRNLFRSTEMHNTLNIIGYEQNDFNKYDLFCMEEQTFSKCKSFSENSFCGEHYGYVNKCGVVHERILEMYDDKLIIKDSIFNKINKKNKFMNINKCKINLVLDCYVNIILKEKGIELVKNGKKIFIQCQGEYELKETFISYRYGHKISTKELSYDINNQESKIKIMFT